MKYIHFFLALLGYKVVKISALRTSGFEWFPFLDRPIKFKLSRDLNSDWLYVTGARYIDLCLGSNPCSFPHIKTVVDLGAHCGFFSVWAASLGKAVIAVEASIDNFQLLSHNLSDFRDVYALNRALIGSDCKDGDLFFQPGKRSTSGQVSADRSPASQSVESINLPQIEQMLLPFQGDILLKIDIEGGEHLVKNDLAKLLTQKRFTDVVAELHGTDKSVLDLWVADVLLKNDFEVESKIITRSQNGITAEIYARR